MKIYYAHYRYGASADDAFYYSGSNGKKHLSKENAIKEAEEYMKPSEDSWGDEPISYTIIEEEVFE